MGYLSEDMVNIVEVNMNNTISRCRWVNMKNEKYIKYHDEEWGVASFDDNYLFEMLILEGAQAGLSWETILNKREDYKKAFDNFMPEKIAQYDDDKIEELMNNKGIVRNKRKINSAIRNANVFLDIQDEYGSFSKYIWNYVDYNIIKNKNNVPSDIPTKTELSDLISKDLKKRGMSFVGSTIIYSFMQAIGMVDDHEVGCFKYEQK